MHDTDAFQDEKITELFMAFGYEGLGLFYTILERLAAREKPIRTEVLKRQLGVGKKLEKIWKFLEEIELISSENGETFNKRLANFLETFDKKRENTKKRVAQFRENQDSTENVTRYNRVRNTSNSNSIEVNKEDNTEDKSSVNPLLSVEDIPTPSEKPMTEVPQKPPEAPSPSSGSPPPKKSKSVGNHLFRTSPFYDEETFVKALAGTEYEIYDLRFYHRTVKNWADSKNAMRADWMATARNFMLSDAREGKAKLRSDLSPYGSQQQSQPYHGRRYDDRNGDAQFGAAIDALADAKYGK
ncbi:DUF4373 domain-containing protein [Larkinella soli]|uniref:DUF4373 domain-containing protein n=1 Tax=Larkinella soli TaxID=1770527 RepID=UPI0013E346B5|nr:DUF4373 domain-containing protein [Larkinella soli]